MYHLPLFLISSIVTFALGWKLFLISIPTSNNLLNLTIGIAMTSSIMIYGFSSYDEIFVLGFIFPFLYSFIKKREFRLSVTYSNISLVIVFALYWIFELVQGYILFTISSESYLRKIRWFIFIFLLLFLYIIFKNRLSYNLKIQKSGLLAIVIYLLSISLIFIYYVMTTGSTGNAQYAQKYDSQIPLNILTNSAYFSLTLVFFFYLALKSYLFKIDLSYKILIHLIIFFSYFISLLIYSRSTFASILLLNVLYIFYKFAERTSKRRILLLLLNLLGSILSTQFVEYLFRNSAHNIDYSSTLVYDATNFFNAKERLDQLEILITYISYSDLSRILFGHGIRTSDLVLSKMFSPLVNVSNFDFYFVSNLLIEFGLVGTFIFIMLIALNFKPIYNFSQYKFLDFAMIVISLSHSFITNVFDNLLFYVISIILFQKIFIKSPIRSSP
jgi:hypothetical protein